MYVILFLMYFILFLCVTSIFNGISVSHITYYLFTVVMPEVLKEQKKRCYNPPIIIIYDVDISFTITFRLYPLYYDTYIHTHA